jgi:hypothetical protein
LSYHFQGIIGDAVNQLKAAQVCNALFGGAVADQASVEMGRYTDPPAWFVEMQVALSTTLKWSCALLD